MSESSSEPASSTGTQAEDGALRLTDVRPPVWTCEQYGGYEHDWMDCPECVAHYERWLDEDRP